MTDHPIPKQCFLPRDIIWSQDKKPYLVVHVYRNATFVVDLQEKGLATPKVILERDYDLFKKEEDT